jgi:hypothetical protein
MCNLYTTKKKAITEVTAFKGMGEKRENKWQ